MERRRVGLVALAALVVLIHVAAAWPLDAQAPLLSPNRVERLSDGSLRFEGGLARSVGAPGWLDAVARDSQLEVTLVARSRLAEQRGPARLLTISENVSERNLTIGQEGVDLVVRLLRPGSDRNGKPELVAPGVLAPQQLRRIELAVGEGELRVDVDGERVITEALGDGALAGWDTGHTLGLGNELTGSRPWVGDVIGARVRAGGATIDYLAPGALETPSRIWLLPLLSDLIDPEAIGNGLDGHLLAFLLLGALAPALVRGLRRPSATAVLILGVGLSTELAQLFFATREPSVLDLAVDVVAGAAGFAAWAAVRRLARPPWRRGAVGGR